MADALRNEIEREIAENTILVYGKGTKEMPRCGFTHETIEFFNRFGYPFAVIDVLENMPKRDALSAMANWPTLPKVFIGGKEYGGPQIPGPKDQSSQFLSGLTEHSAGREDQERP